MALQRKHRTAVTLLELTIVLLVLGLITAVTAPRFGQTMRAMQSRAVAMQIAAHLNYARQTAINQGRAASLTFNPAGDGYSSVNLVLPGHVDKSLQIDLHQAYDQSVSALADFQSANASGTTTILFDLEGVPFVGPAPMLSGTITVAAPGTPTQYITVSPGTGIVKIDETARSTSQNGGSN